MLQTGLVRGLLQSLSPRGPRGRLTILQFHRVPLDGPDIPDGEMPLSGFRQLLDTVSRCMNVVSLPEAIAALPAARLPSRAVAITFDDGYAEWIDHVAPALQQLGLPATFFVTTGQLFQPGMWHERIDQAVAALADQRNVLPCGLVGFDDLSLPVHRRQLARLLQEALKYEPLATREAAIQKLEAQAVRPIVKPRNFSADDVLQLHKMGFTIGAHTVNHPILRSISDADALYEIGAGKKALESIIGQRVGLFAYPNGRPVSDFDQRHTDMVRSCGYDAAVTTGGGTAARGTSLFELPRFTPWTAERTKSALQLARNLMTPAPGFQHAAANARPVRVMLVDNGAGFGGALVAAGTLMKNSPERALEYHVVTNVPVPSFGSSPAIRSHVIRNDRRFNFRPAARRAHATLGPWLARISAFCLGRLDDVVNRLPYFTVLLLHALRVRPHVIHGNNEPFSNREVLFVARLLGIPYVQHLRGPYPRVAHIDWLLQLPGVFVPVSRWLANELRQDGVAPARLRQVYDGTELVPPRSRGVHPQSLRAELGLPLDAPVVAMVGMLVPWKGQDLFVQAVRLLAARRMERTAFLVVGSVPQWADATFETRLFEQAQDLMQQGIIHFTGYRDDIAQLMSEFDVVVSASLEPEPLGLVMLEGLAAGCEFVGPAHGAALEATELLGCGVLFKPGDAAALADAMALALARRREPAGDSRGVNERLAQSFSPQQCVDLTMRIYAELAAGGRQGSAWLHPQRP